MKSKLIKSPNRASKAQTNSNSGTKNFLFCLVVFLIGFVMWWRVSNIESSSSSIDNNNAQLALRGNNNEHIDHIADPGHIKTTTKIYIQKKRRIAFAITITKDGSFQDGAAVLAYSLYNANMTKSFDISLVAFVHPNVTTSRPILRQLGYHVIEAQTPIKYVPFFTF